MTEGYLSNLSASSRREFCRGASFGLGSLALASLLNAGSSSEAATIRATAGTGAGLPTFSPRAKRVIWLFQSGGPSQMDLFDYKPGTNTDTFTRREWPRFEKKSCEIKGQPTAKPVKPEVAAQACSGITNPEQKADCIFDVSVTGETGFAETYMTMQKIRPHGTGWQPVLAGGRDKPQPKPDNPRPKPQRR